MKRCSAVLGVAALATLAQATASDVDPAQALIECAARNAPTRSFLQAAEFDVIQDGAAQRRIGAELAGMRDDQGVNLNILVSAPSDVAGTALLLRQNESGRENMRMYLPALQRVRPITGGMAEQGILGTDFSYRDIRDIYGALREGQSRWLGSGKISGLDTQRLELIPAAEQESPYQRMVADFAASSCVLLAVEFESPGRGVTKRLLGDVASITQTGERTLLLRYTMHDLERDSQTLLKLGPPQYDQDIRALAFHPGSFYRYRNSAAAPE